MSALAPLRLVRGLAVAADAGLILALIAWSGWRAGLLLALPLLSFLPGLVRGRAYTAAWGGFVVMFYCAGLLAEGVAQPQRKPVAFALAALAAVGFVSLALTARWTARAFAARTGSSTGGGR